MVRQDGEMDGPLLSSSTLCSGPVLFPLSSYIYGKGSYQTRLDLTNRYHSEKRKNSAELTEASRNEGGETIIVESNSNLKNGTRI
jgi:hypothetical protein